MLLSELAGVRSKVNRSQAKDKQYPGESKCFSHCSKSLNLVMQTMMTGEQGY